MRTRPIAPSRHPNAGALAELSSTRQTILDFLVLKALARRAADRQATARELAEGIHRVLHAS